MNTTNRAVAGEADAMRGDLQPSDRPPRPIPYPRTRPHGQFGARR
jgi:hypothetical protein